MRWIGASFLACILLIAGCSSGSGSSSSGGGNITGLCGDSCQAEQDINCPNEGTLEACVSECEAELETLSNACPAEAGSYMQCASGITPICGPNGNAGYTQDMIQNACGAQLQAITACAVCAPGANDDTCDQCLKSSCCDSFKALVTDPQFSDYSACDDLCDVQYCPVPCAEQYPGIGAKLQTAAACLQQNCSTCI